MVASGVQGTFTFVTGAKPLVDDGKARVLAVAYPKRIAGWPDVPTMAELGFTGFEHAGFVGLAAPAKTPPQVVAYLNKQLNETINTPTFKQRMEQLGMTVPSNTTPETFAAYMRREIARQAELAKLSGHAPAQR